MKIAFDTNVLAYAEGINGAERRDVALNLIRRLPQEAAVVPAQVLGELFNVLVRKGEKSRSDARDALLSWRDTFPIVETSPEVMLAAADLATDHQLGIMGRGYLVGRVASGLSSAFVRGSSGRFHLGRGDGGQSILLATARSAECFAGGGCRIARTSGSHCSCGCSRFVDHFVKFEDFADLSGTGRI